MITRVCVCVCLYVHVQEAAESTAVFWCVRETFIGRAWWRPPREGRMGVNRRAEKKRRCTGGGGLRVMRTTVKTEGLSSLSSSSSDKFCLSNYFAKYVNTPGLLFSRQVHTFRENDGCVCTRNRETCTRRPAQQCTRVYLCRTLGRGQCRSTQG